MHTILGWFIIGFAVYTILMLLVLGLCQSAYEGDEEMYEAYKRLREGAE